MVVLGVGRRQHTQEILQTHVAGREVAGAGVAAKLKMTTKMTTTFLRDGAQAEVQAEGRSGCPPWTC